MRLLYIGVNPDFVEVWSSSFETEEPYLLNVTADKTPFKRVSYASISPVSVQSNSCHLIFLKNQNFFSYKKNLSMLE